MRLFLYQLGRRVIFSAVILNFHVNERTQSQNIAHIIYISFKDYQPYTEKITESARCLPVREKKVCIGYSDSVIEA